MGTSLAGKVGWGAAGALALLLVASWAGMVSGGPLDPDDPPGSTMKTLQEVEPRTPISEVPFVIGEEGSYYLTGNLTQTESGPGIQIAANNVTLDLNGFAINGTPGTSTGIIASANTKNISIRNGTVRLYGDAGISLAQSDMIRIEDITVEGVSTLGMSLGTRAIVEDCVVRGGGTYGILLSTDSRVSDCVVTTMSWNGIRLGARSTASDCVVSSSGAGGLNDALKAGIYAAQGATVRGCSVTSSGGSGIILEDQAYIEGNNLVLNQACGLKTQAGSLNRIERNQATNNVAGGFCITTTDNILLENTASGNAPDFDVIGGNVAVLENGGATLPRSNVSY